MRYVLALDLGRNHDPSAVALLEIAEDGEPVRDYVTWSLTQPYRTTFRHLARWPLGLDYPAQLDRLRRLVASPSLMPHEITLVVDATGVGAAVMDMLRKEGPRCRKVALTITPSGEAHEVNGGWHVSRAELLSSFLLGMQRRQFSISRGTTGWRDFCDDLTSLRARHSPNGAVRLEPVPGAHDDLVIAAAMAWWFNSRPRHPIFAPHRLL